jgi:hypothetical protein
VCRDWLFFYYDDRKWEEEGGECLLPGWKEQQAKDESSATLTAKPSMAKPRIRTRRQMHVKIDGAEKKFPFFFLKQYNSIILPA